MTVTKEDRYLENEQKLIQLMLNNKRAISDAMNSGIASDMFSERHRDLVDHIYSAYKSGYLLSRDNYQQFLLQKYGKSGQVLTGLSLYDACMLKVTAAINDMPPIKKMLWDGCASRHTKQSLEQYEQNLKQYGASEAGHKLTEAMAQLPSSKGSKADIRRASEIQPRKIHWLWKGRLALGRTNMISGEGGVGKGALTIDICSRISTGRPFPFTGEATKGKAVILSAEDNAADTIVPRLIAAEANLDNILLLNSLKDGSAISLDTDIEIIKQVLQTHRDIRLIVIDPISAYMGNTKDVENEVRGFMRPLEKLAQEYNVAVLIIKHFKKGPARAKERTSGTIAWTNSVRVALGVSPDTQDSALKHLYIIKSNNADENKIKSLTYRTVPSNYDPDVVKIEWGEETDFKADDFTNLDGESNKLQKAIELLKSELANGPVSSETLMELAKDHGIGRNTMFAAKDKIGVKASKASFGGSWRWSLSSGNEIQDITAVE